MVITSDNISLMTDMSRMKSKIELTLASKNWIDHLSKPKLFELFAKSNITFESY